MIDIHSHVLYGLDDGARTKEDSLAMLRMAAAHGTTAIVATPHANTEYRFDPERIAERLGEIAADLQGSADGAIQLYSGCDFHLSYDNIEDAIADPRKYTINGKRYLLVEFSDLLIFKNTAAIFERLGEAGIVPVITHPERNGLLRQRIGEIGEWVAAGARVQVTGQSLTGEFGSKAQQFCRDLLERGLVHFAASDAHDCERRPPRLDQARAWLEKNYGRALAEALCVANPRAAVEGGELEPPGTEETPRPWFKFWR